MKKLLYLFCAVIIAACSQTEKPGTMVTLSGTIENPKSDLILIRGTKEHETVVIDSINVDENGKFIKSFELEKAGYFKFYHSREYANLFLTPGDSLYISLNTEKFDESIQYDGKGAGVNNFLAEKMLMNEELNRISHPELYSLEKEQFISRADSVKNVRENHLGNFLNKDQNISEKFKKFEQADILYSRAWILMNYPDYYKHFSKKDSVKLGEDYYSFLTQLNVNDGELIDLEFYTMFLKSYLNKKTDDEFKNDSTLKNLDNAYTSVKLRLSNEIFTDETIKNYMLYTLMATQIKYEGIKNTEALMADFVKNCTDQKYLTKVKELYSKWQKLAEGLPAPLFSYPDITGDTVSLSDFKGKYVYIDVWATWCRPCRAELPHLEKLQEHFKDKNIVFISVSVDETKEPWEKMVKEKELMGVHLFAKGRKSSISKEYLINSIPRFLLIDSEGKIIDANAPRPSGEIKEILKNLEGLQI
ncbi:MAG: TlpA family protein disulfide reductase [Bacteroidetes bacterium]|nr:TlpA family protein disulfide reductase [Bacteroidota bacterium]